MDIIMPGTVSLQSPRLTLRPFELRDAGNIYRNWISDKEIQNNYGEPECKSVSEAEQYLAQVCARYVDGDYFRWAIIENSSKECIGQIAFYDLNLRHRNAEVEYCIGKAYQRKGYATEALRAVIDFTLTKTSIHRVQAFHRGRNSVSGKVLLKAGLKYEGILKGAFRYEDSGQFDDKVYYGLTGDDYSGEDK